MPVLTNHAYSVALGHLRRHQGFGGKEALPAASSTGSLDRFVRAATAVRGPGAGRSDPEKRALALLDSVRMGSFTKWNLVYDLGRRRVAFRTSGATRLRWLDLKVEDASCRTGRVRVLDLEADLEGDVRGALKDYTIEGNRRSIGLGFKGIAGSLPKGALEQLVSYPDRLPCTLAPAR